MSENIEDDIVSKQKYEQLCQSCGACCSYYAQYNFQIPIWQNSPTQPPSKFVQIGKNNGATTRFLRRKTNQAGQNVCLALQGVVGKQCACTIYEQRPSSCTEFDPGSEWCIKARNWAGLEKENQQ